MDLIIPTISQGLLWALLAIGVYLTFRVLDIADLTVEGSFPLGAATAASCLLAGYSPLFSIFAAFVAGMLSGVVTGILCTKLKIPALLAGILTMIALYSVNLRIMGKANLPMLQTDTVFTLGSGLGLDKQLTVENLAEKTNYSPYHFHRVFHEFTGETPGNFITRSRMKKAGELLMTGKLRIGEIAVKVGYNALSSLTKNFNKFYGVSPLQFRKNYKASA